MNDDAIQEFNTYAHKVNEKLHHQQLQSKDAVSFFQKLKRLISHHLPQDYYSEDVCVMFILNK